MQNVVITYPFGGEVPPFHCPACGALLVAHDAESEDDVEHCEHLRFIYLDSIDEFTHHDGDAWDIIERLQDEEDEGVESDESPLDVVTRELASPTALRFSLKTGGMSCGPVWETIEVGIELCPG